MQPNSWPAERTRRLIEMHKADEPIARIADALHVSLQSAESKIRRLRKRGVLEQREIDQKRPSTGRATMQELADAYNACGSWAEVSKQFGYAKRDSARLRYYSLVSRSSEPIQIKDKLIAEMGEAPPPVWRGLGIGEQDAYARALERVERYVATGDARSAAINQAYQETGVWVR